ncbi:hypothetical protein RIU82_20100 [Enterobacter soli]|nr:hypothetical protein [Enterobacter soli]
MKVLEYSVLVVFNKISETTESTDSLKEYLLARGYKVVSFSSEKTDTHAFLGQESQVMAKSETDVDGANLLKKRLLRLFRKVTVFHGEFPQVFMMISLSNATTFHVGRGKSLGKNS